MTQSIMLGTISLNKVAGGLERNIVYLANQLVDEGHKVVLLTFDEKSAKSFYQIDCRVVWIRAGVSQPHSSITFSERIKLIKNIRLAITENNVTKVVVFSHGLLARFLIAGIGLNVRWICSERNALAMYRFIRQQKWNINFILLALVNKITVQFVEYRNDYPFWLKHKIVTIHNPVFSPPTISDLSEKVVLMVGRLASQKRFDIAITAFASVLKAHPEWKLHIVGEGPLNSKLQAQIKRLGIAESVSIRPQSKDIERYYLGSSIFVITSQWEGFPNALAEALSYGLIAVGTAETSGVPQLIINHKNGALIYGALSSDKLAETIGWLITNSDTWKGMSAHSKKITQQFSSRDWASRWIRLLS